MSNGLASPSPSDAVSTTEDSAGTMHVGQRTRRWREALEVKAQSGLKECAAVKSPTNSHATAVIRDGDGGVDVVVVMAKSVLCGNGLILDEGSTARTFKLGSICLTHNSRVDLRCCDHLAVICCALSFPCNCEVSEIDGIHHTSGRRR